MTAERASITTRDLSRRVASVLDRVEHGERLVVTRDGEPIAEIIPIDRAQRVLARWVKDGLISELPGAHSAKAATVSAAARSLLPVPAGPTATEVLLQLREDERA
ncbi:MAG TPA: type II toxin-antitoxin system prevent-host-death family antitoxin [Micromonosporaceae bacterium]|nr:type II toxin-antitoxin system prevent-host-death family antitoxin [Micromonosporaceae bacterium]